MSALRAATGRASTAQAQW